MDSKRRDMVGLATVEVCRAAGQGCSRLRLLGAVAAAVVLIAACGSTNSDVDVDGAPGEINPTAVSGDRRAVSSRNVTLPVGTVLHLRLTNAVASDTSQVEDTVSAELTQPVVINGRDVVPAGATVSGLVREVDQSGRVKGRAYIAVELTALRVGGRQYTMQTSGFRRRPRPPRVKMPPRSRWAPVLEPLLGESSVARKAPRKAPPSAAVRAPGWCWPLAATRFGWPREARSPRV